MPNRQNPGGSCQSVQQSSKIQASVEVKSCANLRFLSERALPTVVKASCLRRWSLHEFGAVAGACRVAGWLGTHMCIYIYIYYFFSNTYIYIYINTYICKRSTRLPAYPPTALREDYSRSKRSPTPSPSFGPVFAVFAPGKVATRNWGLSNAPSCKKKAPTPSKAFRATARTIR